ncbi:hypothetical protein QZH41_010902, partial [Actinostola sp. cb2023]
EERILLEHKTAGLISFEDLLDIENGKLEKLWKEISRDKIEIIGSLGSGAFGEVKKGRLELVKDEFELCAVKMLKSHATQTELSDLANELNIMANVGEHPNIISLIGACSIEGPLWVVLKLAENGSLLEYLESLRVGNVSYENVTKTTTATNLSYVEKLLFAHGIAEGMKHLADKKCIHRDLAARNVLLGKNNKPMISDFGMSRDVYESGQYEKTTRLRPSEKA